MSRKTYVLVLRLLEEELASIIHKQTRCNQLTKEKPDDVLAVQMKRDYTRFRDEVEEAIKYFKEEWS